MQPQQPYYPPAPAPAPPPPNTGQYNFITEGSYRQPPAFGTPNRKKMIMVVVIGAVVVIGLIWLILSLVFSSGSDKLTPLVGIAQQQTELVRITEAATGNDDISNQDVKNFAENIQLSVGSDKADLLSFLAKNGLKVKDKQLTAKQSSQTDDALEAATANGTYDTTLTRLLQDQLKAYQNTLKQNYTSTSSTVERDLLSSQYNNAQLLLEQTTQHS